MTRHLYRFYLYFVFIALLIYATVAIERFLYTIFLLTSLRGQYLNAPGSSEIVQSTTFTLVSLIIAGALAGLHYWLIRRDISNDPAAGGSAIRALFLNLTEAISISIAVPAFGYEALYPLGLDSRSDATNGLALGISTLILAGIIELERRRTSPGAGAATVFQRLHLYGVQLLLLAFFSGAWMFAFTQIIDGLLSTSPIAKDLCETYSNCTSDNPLLLVLTLLWFLVAWTLYCWATRNDKSPLMRLIVQYLSLATGISFIVFGLYKLFFVLFLDAFQLAPSYSEVFGPYAINNFIAPLTLGVIVIALSHYWLRRARQIGLIEQRGLLFTEYAIIAILAGVVFWWGCGNAIYYLLESLRFDGHDWANTLALIISGVGYLPFDLYLRKSNRQEIESAASPRRGLVLALLGAGILAFAIGGATALYAWVTALFGSPIQNWPQVAHTGLAAFFVGAVVLIVYLQAARYEHLFTGKAKTTPEPVTPIPAETAPEAPTTVATTPEPSLTIEQILDELLAGRITRDEAAARLHRLESPQEPVQQVSEDTEKPVY